MMARRRTNTHVRIHALARPGRRCRRSGNITVTAAMVMPVAIAMLALSIESGMMYVLRTQLQRTADAAALAAALELGGPDSETAKSSARAVAEEYVDANPLFNNVPVTFNANDDVVFGKTSVDESGTRIVFSPGEEPATGLRVTVRYDLGFRLGRVLGKASTLISATAVASGRPRDYMTVIDLSGSMASDTNPSQVAADLIAEGIVPPGYFDGPNAPDPRTVAYAITYNGSNPQFQGVYAVGEKFLPPRIRVQPLKATKDAAAMALDIVMELGVDDQAGAVGYDSGIVWVEKLTFNFERVKAKLLGSQKRGGTSIHKGLEGARLELMSSRARPLADKVVVLITDGKSNTAAAIAEATRMADLGMIIHVIGIGSGVDYALLNSIASIGRGKAVFVSDTSSPDVYSVVLSQTFRDMATDSIRVTLIE